MLHHLLASQEGINILFFLNNWKTVTKLKAKSKCGESFSKSSFFSKFGNEIFKWEYCDRISPFFFSHFDVISLPKNITPQWTKPTSIFFFDKFLHCGKPKKIQKNCKLNKGCVSHCGLAIYIGKYFKGKQELWILNISSCKNIIFKKIL